MPRRKLNYGEGDWLAVPVRDGGLAVGVVARMDGKGGVVGYFFGPRRNDVPALEDVDELELSWRVWRIEYVDDDLDRPVRETRVSQEEAESLPRNGVLGAGEVELVLTTPLRAG